eukprot:509872-Hanusia_phi.AAC.1
MSQKTTKYRSMGRSQIEECWRGEETLGEQDRGDLQVVPQEVASFLGGLRCPRLLDRPEAEAYSKERDEESGDKKQEAEMSEGGGEEKDQEGGQEGGQRRTEVSIGKHKDGDLLLDHELAALGHVVAVLRKRSEETARAEQKLAPCTLFGAARELKEDGGCLRGACSCRCSGFAAVFSLDLFCCESLSEGERGERGGERGEEEERREEERNRRSEGGGGRESLTGC